MKLAYYKMGFTVNFWAGPTRVSIVEHVSPKVCFQALWLKSGPCCTCLKCIGYYSKKQHLQRVIHFSRERGIASGDCLSFQFRSSLCYLCLLSFINCFAVCSCPNGQRSIAALTGTFVLYQAKRRYGMKNWAESCSILLTWPLCLLHFNPPFVYCSSLNKPGNQEGVCKK